MLTDNFPKVELSHTPTPLEHLKNLSDTLKGPQIWVKRDDCTGLAMGGIKPASWNIILGMQSQKGPTRF